MKREAAENVPWTRVREIVAQRLGLHFPAERHVDLERGVCGAAQDLGFPDAAAMVDELLARGMETRKLEALARHLTVGETYFFRDAPLLEAVQRKVLPQLIAARRGRDQRLRIWSAGCASGEEAYSLAILLHQLLPDLADWQVTLLGTDVNPAALEKAAAGVYGDWSFRSLPAAVKQLYFERRADGRHVIAAPIRNMVRFESLNLVEDVHPRQENDTSAMDLIFCRNVLMYFTPQQMGRAVRRLHAAMADEGWLAVSPSEASQSAFRQFQTVNFPGAILYQKAGKHRAAAGSPEAVMQRHPVPSPMASLPRVVPQPEASASPMREPQPEERRARALANRGELAQALVWCDRWLARDKLDAAGHYLRALVLIELGDRDGARSALRRTLFLEPGFVLAHFALGNLALADERRLEAGRHFANVERLLQHHDPADLLPQGDGLSAGRLARVVRAAATREASA